MISVPFDIVGATSSHRSTQYSSELTYNMYIDVSDTAGRKGCHDFPGLKPWGVSGGSDRGFHVMSGVLYKINGATLYSVSVNGVFTSLGSVPGAERAIFADDGSTLGIVTGGVIYQWDGSSVTTVSQSVVTNPQWIAWINNQWIIGGDEGRFAVSNVGDITTWNALNFAEAESVGDSLIRGYAFTQLIYLLGSNSVESWFNSGQGNPPFDRQDNSLINIGIAGKYAIGNTDQFMYWLGDDRKVYQCIGASARNVVTPGVAHLIESFDVVSDCIVSTFVMEGQDMVLLTFPSAERTLLFSETFNYWVELGTGTDYPRQWYGNAVIRCYEKNLVSDYRNGNIYELDLDTYTDNGDTRLRIRTLPSFNGKMVGSPGRRITVSKVRINCQMGVGLASGQGSNPLLMCQLSNDGGHTWDGESHVPIGAMGDYLGPVDFDKFANGYDVRFRVKCSDPVYFSLFDGIVDMRDGGF